MEYYVCYSFDNNYCPQAAVAIKSLFESNSDLTIKVFALCIDVEEENMKKVLSLSNENHKIEIIDVNKYATIFEDVLSEWSISAYIRLIIDRVLPPEVNKILYMDCDTIVVSSLKELFQTDLEGNVAGAVYDKLLPKEAKTLIQFDLNDIYVNSGVMLIDVYKWKNDNIGQKCIDYLKNMPGAKSLPDQNAINVVLKNQIKLLPLRYNVDGLTSFLPQKYCRKIYDSNMDEFYDANSYEEAHNSPAIIHFIGYYLGKPWELNNSQPYYKEYAKFAEMTPWGNRQITRVENGKSYLIIYKKFVGKIIKNCVNNNRTFIFAYVYLLSQSFLQLGSKIKQIILRRK
jgi:lipopolysaccharide biosynthesis glycosyltransferase